MIQRQLGERMPEHLHTSGHCDSLERKQQRELSLVFSSQTGTRHKFCVELSVWCCPEPGNCLQGQLLAPFLQIYFSLDLLLSKAGVGAPSVGAWKYRKELCHWTAVPAESIHVSHSLQGFVSQSATLSQVVTGFFPLPES